MMRMMIGAAAIAAIAATAGEVRFAKARPVWPKGEESTLQAEVSVGGDATSLESFHRPRMKAFHGKVVAIFEGECCDVQCTLL